MMTDRLSTEHKTRTRNRSRTAARAEVFLDRVAGGSLWRAYSLIGAGFFVVMGTFTVLSVV